MLRLSELILFLSPFLLFATWRLAAARGFRSGPVLGGAAAFLVVAMVALAWFSQQRSLPGTADYVPAQLEDGRIIPGHAAP